MTLSRRRAAQRPLAFCLLPFLLAAAAPAALAASPDIVISQVYGGGGNSGSTYKNDFIELFNRGTSAVSVTGWSVQYASATGTSWQKTGLTGTIPAGGYYLVQQAQGAGGSVNLPTPDATGTIPMSATAGKVALVNQDVLITTGTSCPSGATIVDFVGFGSTANCFEGAGPTPAPSNTNAVLRANGGCTDSDANSADFAAGAPNPRNSATPVMSCGAPPAPAISLPASVAFGNVTVGGTATMSVNIHNTGTATLTLGSVTLGAGSSAAFSIATPPGSLSLAPGAMTSMGVAFSPSAAGPASGSLVFTSNAASSPDSVPLSGTGAAQPPMVVISQVYGGGGNSDATFKNDFVELYNRGTASVDVTGWSVQYTSSGGTSWQVTALSGTIPPGGYYLVQQAQGSGGTVNLPTPDATGTIAMSATAGKVALVDNATALSGSCPASASIRDRVGYGSAATCFEGAGPAPGTGNTTAALRGLGGCVDTDNNQADFTTGLPTPRNSASPLGDCTAPPPPPLVAIHDIQGAGGVSPLAGQSVMTRGIVTALKAGSGFFIQAPASEYDADPSTSEGLFVFTSSSIPAAAALGNLVNVTGTVQEFSPGADPGSPPLTEISGFPTVTLVSSGNALPAPVALTAADTDPSGTIENLERFEGMRVQVASLTVMAPTGGSISEPNATSTSNGVFYGVITGIARPFREPGVQVPDPLPAGAPAGVPRFDANPERLRVDSDAQPGAAALNLSAGDVVTGLVGPLDYGFRTYTILPDPATPPTATSGASASPVPAPGPEQFTVGSFNLQRFFDTVNDPAIGEPVLTATAFATRLGKASRAIRDVLGSPDILGVQEVENLATLSALASRVNADAVAAGDPDPGYVAYLEEGNDPGGIDVGFLVKSARVSVLNVTQIDKNATYVNPNNGNPETLNDRPSLALEASVQRPLGPAFPVTVIVNHLRSLNGIDDAVDGPRVRAKRAAQAEGLANHVQSRQLADPGEAIVLVGDFNAFQFSDGYVDSIGTIKGTPAPASEVVRASADLVDPDLAELAEADPLQRYSFVFDGSAQTLDHVLATQNLLPLWDSVSHGRLNADFADVLRNDPARPERISDHDPVVAYFHFPPNQPPSADAGAGFTVAADGACQAVVTLAGSGSDPDGDSLSFSWSWAAGSATGASPTVTLPLGANLLTLTVDDGRGGIATATVTITVADETPPALALLGANPLLLELGSAFADPGATASDNCSGDLTSAIVATSTVDTGAVGIYTVVYDVADAAGNPATATRVVQVADTTAPSIDAVSASPDTIWPPNNKMVDVALSVSASDLSGTPACSIASVSSNEPDPGSWNVTGALTLQVRASRNGKGGGRVYTITVACTDASGNSASATATVRVPHDQGK